MRNTSYTGIDNLEIMHSAKNYNRFLLNRIIRHANSFEVYDFGAGTGYFARELLKRGYNVSCIEIDSRLRIILRENGLIVFPTLESIEDKKAAYIYSLNVLEHIKDDREILHRLYSKLKPGGRLFLYVPAFNFLFSSMDKKVGHHRRYERRSLVKKVKESGLCVHEAVYVDTIGYFASILYKYCGNSRGDLGRISMFIYDRVLFPMNSLLDPLFKKILGKNLIVVAEKQQVYPEE